LQAVKSQSEVQVDDHYLIALAKQGQADAPIVWPRQYATVPYTYKKPGG